MTDNRSNLSQRTADILRVQICEKHQYEPGDKLHNEIELSEELGVSRTTLREAIHMLVTEGVLTVERGRGTFVTAQIDRPAGSTINLEEFSDMKVTLRDLYETRMIFEPEAAALACRRASDAEIKEILRLGAICQRQVKQNPKGKQRIQSESAFHNAIVRASHNDFLSRFVPVVTETIEKTFDLDFNLDVIAEDAYKDHVMIMSFLEKRDAQALKSAMTIHLHHAIWNEQLEWDEQ